MKNTTPRTDAVQFQPRPISLTIEIEMFRALSRKLERELAASQAEVEMLMGELQLAVMLAEEVADEWVDPDFFLDSPEFIRLRSRINQIKATINQDNQK